MQVVCQSLITPDQSDVFKQIDRQFLQPKITEVSKYESPSNTMTIASIMVIIIDHQFLFHCNHHLLLPRHWAGPHGAQPSTLPPVSLQIATPMPPSSIFWSWRRLLKWLQFPWWLFQIVCQPTHDYDYFISYSIILSVDYFKIFDICLLQVYNLSKLTDWRTAYGIGELKEELPI